MEQRGHVLDGEQEPGLVKGVWFSVTPFIHCLGGNISLHHWYCDHLACIPGGEYRASVVPGMIDLPAYTLERRVGCGVVPHLLRSEGAWHVLLEGSKWQDYPGLV